MFKKIFVLAFLSLAACSSAPKEDTQEKLNNEFLAKISQFSRLEILKNDGTPEGTIGDILDGGRTITLSNPTAPINITMPGIFQKAISSSEAEYTYPEEFDLTLKGYRFTGEDLMETLPNTPSGFPVKAKLSR